MYNNYDEKYFFNYIFLNVCASIFLTQPYFILHTKRHG